MKKGYLMIFSHFSFLHSGTHLTAPLVSLRFKTAGAPVLSSKNVRTNLAFISFNQEIPELIPGKSMNKGTEPQNKKKNRYQNTLPCKTLFTLRNVEMRTFLRNLLEEREFSVCIVSKKK